MLQTSRAEKRYLDSCVSFRQVKGAGLWDSDTNYPGTICELLLKGENSHRVHLANAVTQQLHAAIWYILGPYSRYMGTPLSNTV